MASIVSFISLSEIFIAIQLYTKNRTVYRYNSTIVEPEKLAAIVVLLSYFRTVLWEYKQEIRMRCQS